jgi:hypothetical protein
MVLNFPRFRHLAGVGNFFRDHIHNQDVSVRLSTRGLGVQLSPPLQSLLSISKLHFAQVEHFLLSSAIIFATGRVPDKPLSLVSAYTWITPGNGPEQGRIPLFNSFFLFSFWWLLL